MHRTSRKTLLPYQSNELGMKVYAQSKCAGYQAEASPVEVYIARDYENDSYVHIYVYINTYIYINFTFTPHLCPMT